MSLFKNIITIIKLLIVFGELIESKPNWTYEVVSLTTDNQTPDVITSDLRNIRVSRGVYAVSGTFEVKKNLTDDLHLIAFSYYSPTGSSNYIKTPFGIPEITLTQFMNTFYKDLLMDSLAKCAENAQIFDTFVAPATKRFVTVNNCRISNDNMPSHLKSGYYKIEFKVLNEAIITYTAIINIEQEQQFK